MSEQLLTVVFSGVFSVIAALAAVWVAWRKAPVENRNTEADTAARYQQIASDAAERVQKMQEQLDKLQGQVDELERQLQERDRLIEDWQSGITRLIQQLESHELKPVWRPKARGGEAVVK